jgi:hypothetical protein
MSDRYRQALQEALALLSPGMCDCYEVCDAQEAEYMAALEVIREALADE